MTDRKFSIPHRTLFILAFYENDFGENTLISRYASKIRIVKLVIRSFNSLLS